MPVMPAVDAMNGLRGMCGMRGTRTRRPVRGTHAMHAMPALPLKLGHPVMATTVPRPLTSGRTTAVVYPLPIPGPRNQPRGPPHWHWRSRYRIPNRNSFTQYYRRQSRVVPILSYTN